MGNWDVELELNKNRVKTELDQARDILRNAAWLGTDEERERIEKAVELLCGEPCEDAISRQAMHIELEKWITYGEYKYSNATKYLYDSIDRLPSVTPKQRTGHCKDCKRWKDSDGTYRRGVKAESQCPINRKEVYEGNGYCYMFEQRESEDQT